MLIAAYSTVRPSSARLQCDRLLVDMSAFTGIPAVLAVVRSRTSKLAPFAIGAAGAATVERACIKAATEAMHTRTWMKTEQREGRTIHDTSDLSESLRSLPIHEAATLIEAKHTEQERMREQAVQRARQLHDPFECDPRCTDPGRDGPARGM
ncbi:MAG: YcaO-like family protein [Propioniciclava sp.]